MKKEARKAFPLFDSLQCSPRDKLDRAPFPRARQPGHPCRCKGPLSVVAAKQNSPADRDRLTRYLARGLGVPARGETHKYPARTHTPISSTQRRLDKHWQLSQEGCRYLVLSQTTYHVEIVKIPLLPIVTHFIVCKGLKERS